MFRDETSWAKFARIIATSDTLQRLDLHLCVTKDKHSFEESLGAALRPNLSLLELVLNRMSETVSQHY